MASLLQAFAAETAIEAEYLAVSGAEYPALIQQAIVEGGVADVIGFLEGTQIRQAVKQLVPLAEVVPVDALIPSARAQVEFDGDVWGCPFASYSIALLYHRSLLEKAGVAAPTTWDDLLAICDALAAAGQAPLLLPSADAAAPYYWYCLAATSVLGPDGWPGLLAGERRLTDPDLLAAGQLLVDLGAYTAAGSAETDYLTGRTRFANGEAAMMVGSSADLAALREFDSALDLGVVGFPADSGGPPTTLTGLDLIHAVNAFSYLVEEAKTLTGWLASPVAQQIVADRMALPAVAGVTPADPLAAAFVAARAADFPVWFALPALERTFLAAAEGSIQDLIAGGTSPADFATVMQESIDQCLADGCRFQSSAA